MNDTVITIIFKDGTEHRIACFDYQVKNGCLAVIIRFGKTRIFPLDNIKEFNIS